MRKNEMTEVIQTENLSAEDLPRKYARWSKIVEFASTFDIQSEFENGVNVSGLTDITVSSTVQEIRAALYCEWRRYNHRCSGPEQEVEKQAWEAIESLRNKLNCHA